MHIRVRRPLFLLASLVLLLTLYIYWTNTALHLLYGQKIWKHRTNDTPLLDQRLKKGYSVEADAVFDTVSNTLDIHHPPDPPSGITATHYLTRISSYPKARIWLDIKNLDLDNVEMIRDRLLASLREHGMPPDRLIVESQQIEALRVLRKVGFPVAYYLPHQLWELPPHQMRSELKKLGSLQGRVHYFSSNYRDHALLREHFPNQALILWFNGYGKTNEIKARYLLHRIGMDPNVKVLLVP